MIKRSTKILITMIVILSVALGLSLYRQYATIRSLEETFMISYTQCLYNSRNMTVEGISEEALNEYKKDNIRRCAVMESIQGKCRFKKNHALGPVLYYLRESSERYTFENPTFTHELYDKLAILSEDMYSEDVSREVCDMFSEVIKE